jgi:hypothetical protein
MSGKSPEGGDKPATSNNFKMMNEFDKFGSGMKGQLLKDQKEQMEKAKREHEDIR